MAILKIKHYKILLDAKDYEAIKDMKWRVHVMRGTPYVTRNYWDGKMSRQQFMHRAILGAKKGQIVDHKNRNTLDNRRNNLRIVTSSESNFNRTSRPRGLGQKTGYFGVVKVQGGFMSMIRVNRRWLFLGYFGFRGDGKNALKKAAKAYDKAALHHNKSKAKLNFPYDPRD